ncbi:D-alanyl-D-alanine carboxypeptidase/D-alanyl-D-alanine endopeptidase [Neobacillus sp. Marseille-QA0830]
MKRFNGRWAVILLTCMLIMSLVQPVNAQTTEEQISQLLKAYVDQLASNANSEGMSVGYEVYSLKDDKTLASYQAEKTFVPASTFKLLVAATATGKWAKDMTIPTKVFLTGNLSQDGILNGDIILKGYGDPTLTVNQLDAMAKTLTEQGIHKVNGNIIVDESYFDDQYLGENWMWDDENFYYNMEMSALSVRENIVDVNVKPGSAVGEPAKVSISPAPDYMTVVNTATTVAGNKASLTIDRTLGKNEIAVSGTIGKDYSPNGYTQARTIHDPASFTGTVFRDLLKDHGITFKDKSAIKKGTLSDNARLAATTQSAKLDDILTKMLKESNNFYAEMLTKQLGAKENGTGSITAGAQVIKQHLVDDLGLDADYIQKDGSGLTRLDHISPHAFTLILKGIYDSPERDRFIPFLPIAGVDGTLKSRMKGTAADGNVKAKTGSMSGVNTLAGYVTTKDGQTFAFSIMCNGIYKSSFATNIQNQISIALASFPELPAAPVSTPVSQNYPLASEFDPILDDSAFQGLIKGAVIYSTKNQETLYARNAQSLLTPGASVKLLTTASALDNLGQNYRFKTELYTTGTVTDGVLNGDVIIKGYGDPTIASNSSRQTLDGPTLEGMAQDLKNAGIHLVKGNIIVDSQFFTDDVYAPGWTWDQESDATQPEITALSVNHGTVRITFEPGKVGKSINIYADPNIDANKIVNSAVTGEANAENTLQIKRTRNENTIEISGTLPAGTQKGYKDITVEAPQLYTGYVFKDELKQAGVNVSPLAKVMNADKPAEASLVKTYQSPALSEIVRYMNHQNDNFTAEMTLRTLGAIKSGKGTFDAGINSVHSMMDQVISTEFDMMDGSGWTTYTQISAAQVASLLAAETNKPTFQVFYDSLANAGSSQLVVIEEKRADMPGLSGYVKTKDGDLLAFSLLLNGYSPTPSKQLVHNFAQKLLEVTR